MLIHADADAFFASVEARDDPTLRGRPFAVAAGIVACASYEARQLGVHGGMPLRQAQRVAPGLVVVEPRYAAYERASADLFALFGSVTSWVEPGSMEEAFLDVRPQGLDAPEAARVLRSRAAAELGLPVSMGVGTTKLMAKVASRRAKPDGLVVVTRAEDPVVRRALRIDQVWGVGPANVAALASHGIRTVADVEGHEVRSLAGIVGTMIARRLAGIAAGTDDATIRVPGPRRSTGAQRTISPATRRRSVVEDVFAGVVASALARVTEAGVEMTRVDVEVRFDDGGIRSGAHRLDRPTADARVLASTAGVLLDATAYEEDGRGVSLVGVSFAFRPAAVDPAQLALPLF